MSPDERIAALCAALEAVKAGATFESQESRIEAAFELPFSIDGDEAKRRSYVAFLVMRSDGVGIDDIIEAIRLVDYKGGATEVPRKIVTPGKIGVLIPSQARARHESLSDEERARISAKYRKTLEAIALKRRR